MKRILSVGLITVLAISVAFSTVAVADNNKIKDVKNPQVIVKQETEQEKAAKQVKVEQLMKDLLNLYAKEDKIDLEEDQLELDYKAKKFNLTSYKSQKAALEKREADVEYEIDAKKLELNYLGFTTDDWLSLNKLNNKFVSKVSKENQPKVDKIVEELKQLYIKENALDSQEDALEFALKFGHTNSTSYKTQMKELKMQEDALELKEKQLKIQLKQYGYYSSVVVNDMLDDDFDDIYDDDDDFDDIYDDDDDDIDDEDWDD